MSCSQERFTNRKIFIGKTSHILWTYSYSQQNVFWRPSKKVSSKHEVVSEYPNLIWAVFFQNINFFHFFWWSVCREVTMVFSRCKDPVWPNRSDILSMSIKPGECFLGFWKNVSAQKWGFLKIFQTYFDLAYSFLRLNVFECV